MNYTQICKDLFESMPLVQFLFDEYSTEGIQNCCIYGGFMRWLITYVEENQSKPTSSDVEQFLTESDMDIRIRTWNLRIYKIYQKVKELNGFIEYMGCAYSEYFKLEKLVDCNVNNRNYYSGNYGVWLPAATQPGKYLHFDISIFPENGTEYMTDFTVNTIQYNPVVGVFTLGGFSMEKALYDICNKVLDHCSVDTKRIYRGNKLFQKGYNVPTENTNSDVSSTEMRQLCTGTKLYREVMTCLYGKPKWETFYIYENVSEPSVLNPDTDIIHITRHKPVEVTRDIFEQSPFVQYLLDNYSQIG